MSTSGLEKVERGLSRTLGAVLGLVLGLLLGFVGALLLFGFGDAPFIGAVVGGLLGAIVCFLWPAPILFVVRTILGILGLDV